MTRLATLAAAGLAACLAAGAARGAECALALALALDISSSVNEREYLIQRDGLAAALRDDDVRAALLAAPGSVRIMAFEWSGWQQQDVIAGWTAIGAESDIDRLAAKVERHARSYTEFPTAIGRALQFGAGLFGGAGASCARRVIDVSGDGVNNEHVEPDELRRRGALAGITVNGLVIKGATPDPEAYYRRKVIGGPGAFMIVARNGFRDYPDLIVGKLLREIEPPMFIGAVASPRRTR